MKTLRDLKQGEYFTIKPIENPTENQVYIRGEYDRTTNKYNCIKFSDCLSGGREFRGDKVVYTEFTF